MEKKRITACHPITVAGTTIIPVAQTLLNYRQGKHGVSLSGTKQPIGIVVISPEDKRAFSMNGKEIPLGQLMREAPDLEEIITTISK